MKRIALALGFAALISFGNAKAAGEQVIPLWTGAAPGSETWTWQEEGYTTDPDGTLRFRNVVTPTLTVIAANHPNGTGVLVIPGGGFTHLAFEREGIETARWLNSLGVTAFVLKYRVAHNGDMAADVRSTRESAIPLARQDTLQAIHILRQRGAEWGLTRLGVVGYSAGGFLCAGSAAWVKGADRPDFVAPIYPAMPSDFHLAAGAPPAFLVVSDEDSAVTSKPALELYTAWHEAHVPVELHIYTKGKHGFAVRKTGIPTDTWNERLKDWMTMMGFLPKP